MSFFIRIAKPFGVSAVFLSAVLASLHKGQISEIAEAPGPQIARLSESDQLPKEKLLENIQMNSMAKHIEEIYVRERKQTILDKYAEVPFLVFTTFLGGFLIVIGEWTQAHRDSKTITAPLTASTTCTSSSATPVVPAKVVESKPGLDACDESADGSSGPCASPAVKKASAESCIRENPRSSVAKK